jgi:hypothetical protein
VPIACAIPVSDHGTMTATFSPRPAPPHAVAGGDREGLGPDPDSLGGLARRLAEVARAIRMGREHAGEADGLAPAFADLEDALADLAIAAELTAGAVIESDRPSGTRATAAPPTPGARAVSWRLHGLAGALRASHRACGAVAAAARLHQPRSSTPAAPTRDDWRSAARAS